MIIFDIGCCQGEWIAANYTTIDRFIGVEANKKAFQYAKDRFADDENVEILHYLAAENDYEPIPFYVAEGSVGELSTASKWWMKESRHTTEHWKEPVNVYSISLENLIYHYGEPGLIKIDVEGYEYEVLKGLRHKSGVICFEYAEEQKPDIEKSILYLISLGYTEFYLQVGDQYNFRPDEWLSIKNFTDHIAGLEVFRKKRWGMIWSR